MQVRIYDSLRISVKYLILFKNMYKLIYKLIKKRFFNAGEVESFKLGLLVTVLLGTNITFASLIRQFNFVVIFSKNERHFSNGLKKLEEKDFFVRDFGGLDGLFPKLDLSILSRFYGFSTVANEVKKWLKNLNEFNPIIWKSPI